MRTYLGSVILAVVLAACGPSNPGPGPQAAAGSKPVVSIGSGIPETNYANIPKEMLTPIRLAYAAATGSSGAYWLAQETLLYRKYGLDPSMDLMSSVTAVQALIAGEVDIVLGAAAGAVGSALEGSDVVLVASALNYLPFEVWAVPEVKSPGELRGKNFGITRLGSNVELAARHVLKKSGVDVDSELTMVQLGDAGAVLPALEQRAVEGAVLFEPFISQARQLGYTKLGEVGQDLPYPNAAIMTTRSTVRDRAPLVQQFMRAYVEAVHLFKTNKGAALQAMAKYTKLDPSDPSLDNTYSLYSKAFQEAPYARPEAIASVLLELAARNPKAALSDPRDFTELRFVKTLEDEGFIKKLYGR